MAASETVWRGEWFLPGDIDNEDKWQAGTLHVSEIGEVRLELVRGFEEADGRPEKLLGFLDSTDNGWPLILGRSGLDIFTLIQCRTTSAKGFLLPGVFNHTLRVSRALRGVWLDEPDEACFDGLELEIDYMLDWATSSTMTYQLEHDGWRWNGKQVGTSEPVDSVFAKWTDLSFELGISHTQFQYQSEVPNSRTLATTETAYLRIEPEGRLASLSEFDDLTKRIQDLLTLSNDYPCGVRKRTYSMPNPDEPNAKSVYNVESYAEFVYSAPEKSIKDLRQRVFISLADMPFGEILPRWLEMYDKVSLPVGMLLGLQYHDGGYVGTRVFTVSSALESLHRSLYDEPPKTDAQFRALMDSIRAVVTNARDWKWVEERLYNSLTYQERAIGLAKKPDRKAVKKLIGNDIGQWAGKITKARNGLAHADTDGPPDHDRVMMDVWLTRVTSILLSLVLLAELGTSAEVQMRIVTQAKFVGEAAAVFQQLMAAEAVAKKEARAKEKAQAKASASDESAPANKSS